MSIVQLPPVSAQLRDEYASLVAEVDLLVDTLAGRLLEHIRCAPGCSSCCRTFSVCPLERSLLAMFSRPLLQPCGGSQCQLLVDDRCSVYPLRPLICRTQGVPIGYVDDVLEQIEVSACSLNFAESHSFTADDLLFLDPFNSRLAELNRRYCLENGLDTSLRLPLE